MTKYIASNNIRNILYLWWQYHASPPPQSIFQYLRYEHKIVFKVVLREIILFMLGRNFSSFAERQIKFASVQVAINPKNIGQAINISRRVSVVDAVPLAWHFGLFINWTMKNGCGVIYARQRMRRFVQRQIYESNQT